jgi:SNF2 family DNA or RNA helicase
MQFEASAKAIDWVPMQYQLDGIKWLTSRPSAALFWRPGLRKTSTVIASFLDLRKNKRLGVKRMIVFAPLKVCQGVWRQEVGKWKQFAGLKVGFAHGPNKREIIKDMSNDIVLLNYDGILWALDRGQNYLNGFEVVCFDELTRLKATNTRRFKCMKVALHLFMFRWGLTGSPAPNGLMDLFGQVFMLDGGQRLGPFITRFRLEYFHQKPFDTWSWYPNNDTPRRITLKLKDLAHYIDEKYWNKMPTLIDVKLEVELETPAMKAYKQLERDFLMKLENDVVTAANAAVLSGKLRQCASGQVYDEARNVIKVHESKVDALESLVEELAGDPVIVVVAFLHEVTAIRERLGEKTPYLGGGVADGQVAKIIQNWNLGWTPVLLVHPTTVAHGLNLQGGGHNICWFTMTWNAEEWEQLIRRLYRTGQKDHVMNYVLIAKGTIDEYIAQVLVDKAAVQQNLLDGLKHHYGIEKKRVSQKVV